MTLRGTSSDAGLRFAPLTAERWPDLVSLFCRRGARGGLGWQATCWCMEWRDRSRDPEQSRRSMEMLVHDDGRPGLLASTATGETIGWVSVAPRETYGQLLR